jgi:predicted permease
MSLESTFIASLRSVGTAATLGSAGFYLHRRGFMTPDGKKAFARLSEQVTIPCLFFSKIVDCSQNFSDEKCPNITDNLADIWVLLFFGRSIWWVSALLLAI